MNLRQTSIVQKLGPLKLHQRKYKTPKKDTHNGVQSKSDKKKSRFQRLLSMILCREFELEREILAMMKVR